MKHVIIGISVVTILSAVSFPAFSGNTPEKSNGIEYPSGWQNWATLAVSHRIDNNTLRLIVGNDIAITAARESRINPWPDGAVIGKVVWKEKKLDHWEDAVVPEKLVHTEFMMKDSKVHSTTYGWGWGRWLGEEQKPFNKGADSCISCHEPVKERDWVFTEPATFPK